MTSRHSYRGRAIVRGYLRTGFGLACTLLPLGVMQPALWVGLTLTLGASLFLIEGARCARRQLTNLAVDDAGIRVLGPLGAAIDWDRLDTIELNYYSTRRDGSAGWMQLVLRGQGRTIRIDSDIDGFDQIVADAARQALRRGRQFHERTRINLRSLGIDAGSAAAVAPAALVRGGDRA